MEAKVQKHKFKPNNKLKQDDKAQKKTNDGRWLAPEVWNAMSEEQKKAHKNK